MSVLTGYQSFSFDKILHALMGQQAQNVSCQSVALYIHAVSEFLSVNQLNICRVC